jgi:hypothetical protein
MSARSYGEAERLLACLCKLSLLDNAHISQRQEI